MARTQWTDAEVDAVVNRPDITHVAHKDDKFYYRHVNRDEFRIDELKREGFEIVAEEEGGAKPDSPIAIESDGSSKVRNIPGMVLMRRPKELHERIIKKRKERYEHMAKMEEEEAMEGIKKELDKVGITSKLRRKLKDTKRLEDVDKIF